VGWTPKECPNVSNIGDKNVGDKPCQLFKIIYIVEFFSKCRYQKCIPIFHLEFWDINYGKKKTQSQIGNLTYDHYKLKKYGSNDFQWKCATWSSKYFCQGL
jgi:hypothetical protein